MDESTVSTIFDCYFKGMKSWLGETIKSFVADTTRLLKRNLQ